MFSTKWISLALSRSNCVNLDETVEFGLEVQIVTRRTLSSLKYKLHWNSLVIGLIQIWNEGEIRKEHDAHGIMFS